MYNVSNLTCGVSYTIGVSAVNSAGHSRVNQIRILFSKMLGDLDSTGMYVEQHVALNSL